MCPYCHDPLHPGWPACPNCGCPTSEEDPGPPPIVAYEWDEAERRMRSGEWSASEGDP